MPEKSFCIEFEFMKNSGSPLIEVKTITKRFGNNMVFENFSHSIHEGEHQLITGPSGCGKTTLLKILALLEPADNGSIHYNNMDVTQLCTKPGIAHIQSGLKIGYVSQDRDLWPHLTVRDNIMLAYRLNRRDDQGGQWLEQISEQLGLTDQLYKYPGEISGGQHQRCAIARCLIHHPNIILLDESFANLDDINIGRIFEVIEAIVEKGATLVLVSHRVDLPTDIFSVELKL